MIGNLLPAPRSLLPVTLWLSTAGCAVRGAGSGPQFEAPPGLEVTFAEETYGFMARGINEVALAMRQFGPQVGWHRVPAATRQFTDWNYELVREGDACRVGDAVVRLEITMLMPRWTNGNRAPSALQARWRRFLAAVRRHELGHRRLYEEGAVELLAEIAAVPAGPCDGIRARVDAVGREVLARIGARNTEYDADTDGGVMQGVCWPGLHERCPRR